jgi:hypothetical protein
VAQGYALPCGRSELQDLTAAAKTLEIEVQPTDVRDGSGFATSFAAIKGRNPQALIAWRVPANTKILNN